MNNNSSSSTGSILLGMAIGGAIGSAIALMYAPKSGRELRSDIKEKSAEYFESAVSSLDEVYGSAVEKGEALLEEINEMLGSVKESTGDAIASSKNGIEARLNRIKGSVQAFLETYSKIGADNLVEEVMENHVPRKLKKKLKAAKTTEGKRKLAKEIMDRM